MKEAGKLFQEQYLGALGVKTREGTVSRKDAKIAKKEWEIEQSVSHVSRTFVCLASPDPVEGWLGERWSRLRPQTWQDLSVVSNRWRLIRPLENSVAVAEFSR